jgi:hypothetical protein
MCDMSRITGFTMASSCIRDIPRLKVRIGRREIHLLHTTPRNMATAGRKSGTVIQALRYLGQDQVSDQARAAIARQLSSAERSALQKYLIYAPAWIADFLHPAIATSS